MTYDPRGMFTYKKVVDRKNNRYIWWCGKCQIYTTEVVCSKCNRNLDDIIDAQIRHVLYPNS